jgi:nicotinic acid mononucleotide adenylyltransferase
LDEPISEEFFWYPINIDNFFFNKKPNSENVVLLTTGSFCPMHDGHIQMMYGAKAILSKLGYHVAGGIMSFGHSQYVDKKMMDLEDKKISSELRIKHAAELLKEHQWLTIDDWECHGVSRALNFTDVIRRVEFFFKEYDVEIFYVFGGDNEDFKYAFIDRGNCVIIDR